MVSRRAFLKMIGLAIVCPTQLLDGNVDTILKRTYTLVDGKWKITTTNKQFALDFLRSNEGFTLWSSSDPSGWTFVVAASRDKTPGEVAIYLNGKLLEGER